MRLQEQGFSCGAAAVVNALRALGKRVSERTVRALAGTNEDGTDESDITAAVRALGCAAAQFSTDNRKAALAWLMESLRNGRPVIACVDQWAHWVTIVGQLGSDIILIDSTNTRRNRAEHGAYVIRRTDFLRRWMNAKEGCYFGISVSRK